MLARRSDLLEAVVDRYSSSQKFPRALELLMMILDAASDYLKNQPDCWALFREHRKSGSASWHEVVKIQEVMVRNCSSSSTVAEAP